MPETIRSFIAIELPDALKYQIKEYTNSLSVYAPKTRWVANQNLHLTLKFLGDQSKDKLDALLASLTNESFNIPSFKLQAKQIGAFPNKSKPRIIWLGIDSEPQNALLTLRNRLEDRLHLLGFEREQKKFKAHLTLSRIKYPMDFSTLWAKADKNPFTGFSFPVNSFVLMHSKLKQTGAEYSILQNFSLQG